MTLHVAPTRDIDTCVALRRAVFIEEQSVPEAVEQDGRDGEAHHILALLDGAPVGTARILIEKGTGKIGRVCVLPACRHRGIGTRLLETCLNHIYALGLDRAELGAQTHALAFYERLGFTAYGPEFEDAGGQPHRAMEKGL